MKVLVKSINLNRTLAFKPVKWSAAEAVVHVVVPLVVDQGGGGGRPGRYGCWKVSGGEGKAREALTARIWVSSTPARARRACLSPASPAAWRC